ncbi:hypothetical protein F5Y11DRAFT_347506 [Daldinia sp. FL1419]|nr:hypothetical protein F5Y11DRAFT_347506 [Daldinia sp. FL1419]
MSTSSSTVAGDVTPTLSVMTDEIFNYQTTPSLPQRRETVPWPGHTFVIREPVSGKLLTIVGGQLRLEPHKGEQGGYHWICEQKNGWLGFRDPIHNIYMGHDSLGTFIAQVRHHKAHEYFSTIRHPDGGYILVTNYKDWLQRMVIAEDGQRLVTSMDGGTPFEFVKV